MWGQMMTRACTAFQLYQKKDGFWYWFDELKAESLPYKTKEGAEAAIERYRNRYLRSWKPRPGSIGAVAPNETQTSSSIQNR